MINLIFVLGPTNCGKTSLLETAGTLGRVQLVEVGKMLRAKYLEPLLPGGETNPNYQPDYFKGDSSPTHTAVEAFDMMKTGISTGIMRGKDLIFVDGQPRDIQQCDDIHTMFELHPEYNVSYLNLYAALDVRKARAEVRDKDPAKLALSMARMEKDVLKIYEVLCRILSRGGDVVTVDSTQFLSYNTLVDFLRTHMDVRQGIKKKS